MLTTRGWWYALMALALVSLGGLMPPRGHVSLALIGLTLLLWLIGQWLLFAIRAHRVTHGLMLERELRDERGRVDNLWAHRSFEVRLTVRVSGWLSLPYVLLTDRVPAGIEQAEGKTEWEGEIAPGRPADLTYRIHCGGVGRVRFEGVKVQMADLQGLFYHVAFLPVPLVCRVLPPLVDAGGHWPASKRHNLLPPPGVHRHRRAGSGGELLDLRDYMPGDPPKMIAWKVSARRDRLITKEFESEVPVRCTLFVDTSNSVRLGPPGKNALSRQVEIAAAVAQATVGARDLIGLCLFDEEAPTYVRPARTPQHLIQLLNQMADAAGLAPAEGRANVEHILPAAYAFTQEVYPHLLRGEVNAFPFWLPWLFPTAHHTLRRPRRGDFLYSQMRLLLLLYAILGGMITATGVVVLIWLANQFVSGSSFGGTLAWGIIACHLLAVILLVFTFVRAPGRLLFPQRRRHYRWRKHLAAILSVRYGLAPAGLPAMLEDQEMFAVYLQRFLGEHQVPYALPMYDAKGRYLFAAPRKVEVLAKALLRAVALSHDNELFVLLADLLELRDDLGPLLRAVKVAVARHHQVMVVCPWPPGVPAPEKQERSSVIPLAHAPLRSEAAAEISLTDLLQQATTLRFHEAFHRLRRSFARVGVSVICAQDKDPAALIVERLDRLRTMRSMPRR